MKIAFVYSSSSIEFLQIYKKFLKKILYKLNLQYYIINSPQIKKIKTLLKSPHVNKRAKENFWLKISKFKIYLNLDLKLIKIFRYNVPKNIHLKIIYNL